jgi:hypothetical protein
MLGVPGIFRWTDERLCIDEITPMFIGSSHMDTAATGKMLNSYQQQNPAIEFYDAGVEYIGTFKGQVADVDKRISLPAMNYITPCRPPKHSVTMSSHPKTCQSKII